MVEFSPLGEWGKWAEFGGKWTEFDGSATNVTQDEFRTFSHEKAVTI